MKKAVFLTLSALGDILCTTPVIRAFRRRHPGVEIIYIAQSAGFTRVLDHNPDIDLVIYSDRLFVQGLPDDLLPWLRSMPLDLREGAAFHHLDLKFACTSEEIFREHMSLAFARLLDLEIDSVRPVVVLTDDDRRGAEVFVRRPYVIFCMHSVSNPERDDGKGRKKDWPVERWEDLARRISGTEQFDVFAIGTENEAPTPIPDVTPLYGLPIRTIAALLERAECVVTLENGIAHLSAALDAPMVEIYSNMMPLEWACPSDATRAKILYGDPHHTSCDEVWEAVEALISTGTVPA